MFRKIIVLILSCILLQAEFSQLPAEELDEKLEMLKERLGGLKGKLVLLKKSLKKLKKKLKKGVKAEALFFSSYAEAEEPEGAVEAEEPEEEEEITPDVDVQEPEVVVAEKIPHRMFPFAGDPAEIKSFATYLQNHSLDIKRLEKFETMLKSGDQEVVSSKNLEYFFAADSDDAFQDLISGQASLDNNQVREKLAKKWIRNAAVRVFADDLRSFLELVVNGCDATLPPTASVGKFGMGFFSILSLLGLKETLGTQIEVDTNYLTKDGLEGFVMTFNKTGDLGTWKSDDTIKIDFKHKPPKKSESLAQADTTGTTIRIKPKVGNFSAETMSKVKEYVAYMKHYSLVKINLDYQGTQEVVNNDVPEIKAGGIKDIFVTVKNNELSVRDTGTGMSLKVALLKLLVPSSSTKGAASLKKIRQQIAKQPVSSPQVVSRTKGESGGDDSRILMTVNGVVVVNKRMKKLTDKDGNVQDLVIPLPQAVLLTLARDDLEISENGKSFEEKQLNRIIDQSIDDAINGVDGDKTVLTNLYDGLKAWEDQTAAHHIQGRFSGHLKSSLEEKIAQDKNVVPIPSKYALFLKQILGAQVSAKKFIEIDDSLVNYNFSRIEDELYQGFMSSGVSGIEKDAAQEKLIKGQRVYFVDDNFLPQNKKNKALISELGLKGTLFVPRSMLKASASETCDEIICSNGDAILQVADDETNGSPLFIINTYADSINYIMQNGKNMVGKHLLYVFFEMFLKENERFEILQNNPLYQPLSAYDQIARLFPVEKQASLTKEIDNKLYVWGLFDRSLLSSEFQSSYKYQRNLLFNEKSLFIKKDTHFEHDTAQKAMSFNFDFKNNNDWFAYTQNYTIPFAWSIPLFLYGYDQNSSGKIFLFKEMVLSPIFPLPADGGLSAQSVYDLLISGIASAFSSNASYQAHPIVLCLKDASEAQIQELLSYASQEVAKLSKHVATLNSALDGTSYFYSALINIALAEKKIKQLGLSHSDLLVSMLSVCRGLYDRYFNISNSEFRRDYGEGLQKDKAFIACDDIGVDGLIKLLQELSLDYNLLRKLIVFQNQDFGFQTDIELRKQDLIARKLYVPSILSNTPCSLLAKILEESSSIDLVKQILKKAATPDELMFTGYVLLHEMNRNFLNQQNKITLASSVGDLIEHFIRERVDRDEMQAMYEKNRSSCSMSNRLENFNNKSITELVGQYLAQVLNEEDLFDLQEKLFTPEAEQRIAQTGDGWLLSRFMRLHTTGVGISTDLENGDIDQIEQKMKFIDKPFDAGKILQAVEAGSEKNPIEASITECLQNSVDAVRLFFKKLGEGDPYVQTSYAKRQALLKSAPVAEAQLCSIDYELARVKAAADKEHMLLTIIDHVGMPGLETLLTDLILPDYSNKSPEQGNVGDMGNGTFKLYQDATQVTFVTRSVRDSEKVFMLQVKPVRNADQLVADLKLHCVEVSDLSEFKDFFGTRISVLFRPKEKQKNLLSLFATRNFLLNCCGATNIQVHHVGKSDDIILNLKTKKGIERLNEQGEILYEHKKLFTARKRGSRHQSYLTTNGVPFRPLSTIGKQLNLLPRNLLNIINDGVIIDCALGTYEPVQSRTQLKMNQSNQDELKKCCREVVYREGISRAINDDNLLDLYFTHFASKADYDQLIPSVEGFKELNNAFSSNNDYVPLSTFFRFYQSQDYAVPNFVNSVREAAASGILATLTVEAKSIKANLEAFANNFLAIHNSELMAAIVAGDAEKQAFKDQWRGAVDKKFNELRATFGVAMTTYKDSFEKVIKNHYQSYLNKIVGVWVSNKFDNLLPKNLEDNWLTEKILSMMQVLVPAIKKTNPTVNLLSTTNVLATKSERAEQDQFANALVSIPNFNKLKQVLNAYVDTYCQIVGKVPALFCIDDVRTLGFWDGSKININLLVGSITDHLELIHNLLENKTSIIHQDAAYRQWFAPSKGKAPTIPHELEHARRKGKHQDGGAHDDGLDANQEHATFDACATSFVAQALQDGALKKWCTQLQQKLNSVITVAQLRAIIEKLKPLELAHREKVAKEILK